jgi:hypothetical protein
MSAHRFRARLDRLERSGSTATAQDRDCFPNFTIDLPLAKSLRDDYKRLSELVRTPSHGGPRSAAELEEKERLRASIADRARAIGCPAGYGQIQAMNDSNRLHALNCKRMSPRGFLTDAEDVEEARLRARICAFDESPEGRARSRILQLVLKRWRSPAEQEELDRLEAIYPDPPLDRNHPNYSSKDFIEHCRKIVDEMEG